MIFLIFYADLSTLAIAKPVNGSVTFSGRLDGDRSSKTLSDGTQVYSIDTGDEVKLKVSLMGTSLLRLEQKAELAHS